MEFVDGSLRLRIDKQTKTSRFWEAVKQRRVDAKRAKVLRERRHWRLGGRSLRYVAGAFCYLSAFYDSIYAG